MKSVAVPDILLSVRQIQWPGYKQERSSPAHAVWDENFRELLLLRDRRVIDAEAQECRETNNECQCPAENVRNLKKL
jgi:hypothetical protein